MAWVGTERKPYVDASVFIAWIMNETKGEGADTHSAKEVFDAIIDQAKSGAFKIYTSTWTIAEVHKRRGGTSLPDEKSEEILQYFREEFIQLIEVDRALAERAHVLCQSFPENGTDPTLKPGDSIHIAAAERAKCTAILVYDNGLENLNYNTIDIMSPNKFGKEKFELIAPKS